MDFEAYIRSRASLRFPEAVRDAFQFLRDYGFREVSTDPTHVRYEGERTFVFVFHGWRSFEVGLFFGLNSTPDRDYGLSYMVEVTDPDAAERIRFPVARDYGKIVEAARTHAETVRRYGTAVLAGDQEFFERCDQLAKEYWRKHNARQKYDHIRPEADEAFREKDYGKAATLYESIRESLSPAELKKLDYSKRNS